MNTPVVRRIALLGVVLVVSVATPHLSRAKEPRAPHLPNLAREIYEAQSPHHIRAALDRAMKAIGHPKGFADHGAFGDWLTKLPRGRAKHPVVQQRIGWSFIRAKRGAEAIAPLEAALKDNPASGATRSYLGEAFRQAGRLTEAAAMFTTAVRTGYKEKHVHEGLVEAALAMRRTSSSRLAKGLPAYAKALDEYATAKREMGAIDHKTRAMAASWMLEDLRAFDRPTSERGRIWVRYIARAAVRAVHRVPEQFTGADELLYEAARAFEHQRADDPVLYYDVVAAAFRMGEQPDQSTHAFPLLMTMLAEALIDAGRYKTAHALLTRRIEIASTMRAQQALRRIPPDVGSEDD